MTEQLVLRELLAPEPQGRRRGFCRLEGCPISQAELIERLPSQPLALKHRTKSLRKCSHDCQSAICKRKAFSEGNTASVALAQRLVLTEEDLLELSGRALRMKTWLNSLFEGRGNKGSERGSHFCHVGEEQMEMQTQNS